jgi:hypothetical protein
MALRITPSQACKPHRHHTHVYCEVCASIHPAVIEPPDGDDASGRFTSASDILCATCRLIVATVLAEAHG